MTITRKIISVLLVVLMIGSLFLFAACQDTKDPQESESEKQAENNNDNNNNNEDESKSDNNPSGDDPQPPVVTTPAISVKNSGQNKVEINVKVNGENMNVVYACDNDARTYYVNITLPAGATPEGVDTGVIELYIGGGRLYGECSWESEKINCTTDEFIDSIYLGGMFPSEMDVTFPESLKQYFKDFLNGVEMDEAYAEQLKADLLAYMDSLTYIEVEGDMIRVLPEYFVQMMTAIINEFTPEMLMGKVSMTDEELAQISEMLSAMVALAQKTDNSYVFDASLVTSMVNGILNQVPAMIELTPAQLIDTFVGQEGAFAAIFNQIKTSITGETTIGEVIDMVLTVVQETGATVSEEQLLGVLSSVTGGMITEEFYQNLRSMTIDEAIAAASTPGDITVWDMIPEDAVGISFGNPDGSMIFMDSEGVTYTINAEETFVHVVYPDGTEFDWNPEDFVYPLPAPTLEQIYAMVEQFTMQTKIIDLLTMSGEITKEDILGVVDQIKEFVNGISGGLTLNTAEDVLTGVNFTLALTIPHVVDDEGNVGPVEMEFSVTWTQGEEVNVPEFVAGMAA